jgi:PAS domain S-box-containing protein
MTGLRPSSRAADAGGPASPASPAGPVSPAGRGSPADAGASLLDLLDALPDGLLVVDRRACITTVNDATCRLTDYPRDELLGSPAAQRLAPRDRQGRPLWAEGWHRSARLRSVRGLAEQDVVLRRRDGHDITVAVTGVYHRDALGQVVGAGLSLRDAARRARAVSGIEIVSTVSHELRSPLTSVKGYTSLLLNRWDRLSEDQKRMMLAQVNHDADRVTRLITELLDISRLETGRLVLRRQPVDLPRLAASVVGKVRMEYPELDVETTFPEGFPMADADPDKIEQVLTNLVENACKYASPHGLRIEGTAGPDHVSVAVRDHGEGIPPADLPKVFTKFFRRSEGRPTGSGLGLWISRGLVESHGGHLVAESNPGKGSTFRFTLPVIDLDRLQEP